MGVMQGVSNDGVTRASYIVALSPKSANSTLFGHTLEPAFTIVCE